ncbi:MAG TPA: hypothetical protein VGC87_10170 [Pyrinomonadaceae bacterium]|jgi:hypothetical protein
MIISFNSDPGQGYYTFVLQASGDNAPQTYRVNAHQYLTVKPEGDGPWNVKAYDGEETSSVSQRWTVDDPDVLLTTANGVPAFP